ncbi:Ribokinase-like protein, partial [Immersiella caudata]
MKHLVLVGACYLDTILTVPDFPSEDAKLRATSLTVRRGGNCPNTLQVFHQLVQSSPTTPRVASHLISPLPSHSSPATQQILSSFDDDPSTSTDQADGTSRATSTTGTEERKSVLEFGCCLYREEHSSPASSYIVRSSATSSRTIINYNELKEMSFEEFVRIADEITSSVESEDGDADGPWWHFEGRIPETTLLCIRHLRRISPRSTISVEVEKPNRDGLSELAAEANIVFYSRTWAESRGYVSAEACLRGEAFASEAALMLCTWGSYGATAYSPAPADECISISPSRPDIQVVDTVGAGDTFIAGMLYGLICHTDDWSREAKLRFAVELATKKVQREGFAGL